MVTLSFISITNIKLCLRVQTLILAYIHVTIFSAVVQRKHKMISWCLSKQNYNRAQRSVTIYAHKCDGNQYFIITLKPNNSILE